ncbi:MAG: tail fiber domain-containing protein, partial [Pseudobdellovibrio sp.]|nr:tail fiber domain-containing protein [Pseudobdellovibrio sp.]
IVLNPNGGNVGVGTATPTAPLSVSGMIRSDSAAANFSFIGNAGGSNLQIYHPAAGAARVFNSGGDIALQVDSGGTATGNVGIGTSSPAYTLHAAGNIVADRPLSHPYGLGVRTDSTWTVWKRQFAFFSNDGSQLGGLTAHGSTGNTLDRISIGQGLDTSGANGTEWLTVKSNGNVGIGTSAPDKNLTIHSTGLDNYIHLTSSMTGTTLSDGVMIGTGTAGDAAFYNRESTNMIFLTSNTERVRIDPAGKVGIGITTPSQALDVNGYVQSYSDFYDVKTFADGWVIGDYAEVVQAAPAGAAGNSNIIRVSMATTRGNWVESSTYDLVSAHSESDVWREIPATSVNYYTTFTYRCFTVDANGFGGVVKFRIRAIQNSSNCSAASTGSLPIYFKAQVFGHNSGWTKLTSTGTGATVTGYRSSVGSEWNLYTGASRNAGLPTITAKEGSVGIGTTAPTAKLDVNGSIKFGSSALISPAVDNSQLRSNYIPATDQLVDTARSSWAIVAGNSGDQFSIYRAPAAGGSPIYSQLYYQSGNGNAWMAGTLTQASDRRLKKDIVTIQDSLRRINELDGVTYYWIDKNRDNAEQIGLIAQDVEKVFPQAVKTRSDGFKSVAYSALIAPVINAVKELYTKFIGHDQQLEKQQREIASLKAENTEIKKQYLDVQKYICRKDPKADFCKQQ